MSSLYITEFATLGASAQNAPSAFIMPAGQMPPVAEQKLTISGSTGASSAFAATTRFVRIHTDVICHVAVGGAPTAAVTNMRLSADQTEYLAVNGGQKIAVISGT